MARILTYLILIILLSFSVQGYRSAIPASPIPFLQGGLSGNVTFINQSSESSLNVNSSIWWSDLSGWVSGWFIKTGNDLNFNETKLDDRILSLAGGGSGSALEADNNYLYNDSTIMYFNETKLDDTISVKLPAPKTYEGKITVSGGTGFLILTDLSLAAGFVRINYSVSNFTVLIKDLDTTDSLTYMKALYNNGTAQSIPFGTIYDNISINITSATLDGEYDYYVRGVYYG